VKNPEEGGHPRETSHESENNFYLKRKKKKAKEYKEGCQRRGINRERGVSFTQRNV